MADDKEMSKASKFIDGVGGYAILPALIIIAMNLSTPDLFRAAMGRGVGWLNEFQLRLRRMIERTVTPYFTALHIVFAVVLCGVMYFAGVAGADKYHAVRLGWIIVAANVIAAIGAYLATPRLLRNPQTGRVVEEDGNPVLDPNRFYLPRANSFVGSLVLLIGSGLLMSLIVVTIGAFESSRWLTLLSLVPFFMGVGVLVGFKLFAETILKIVAETFDGVWGDAKRQILAFLPGHTLDDKKQSFGGSSIAKGINSILFSLGASLFLGYSFLLLLQTVAPGPRTYAFSLGCVAIKLCVDMGLVWTGKGDVARENQARLRLFFAHKVSMATMVVIVFFQIIFPEQAEVTIGALASLMVGALELVRAIVGFVLNTKSHIAWLWHLGVDHPWQSAMGIGLVTWILLSPLFKAVVIKGKSKWLRWIVVAACLPVLPVFIGTAFGLPRDVTTATQKSWNFVSSWFEPDQVLNADEKAIADAEAGRTAPAPTATVTTEGAKPASDAPKAEAGAAGTDVVTTKKPTAEVVATTSPPQADETDFERFLREAHADLEREEKAAGN